MASLRQLALDVVLERDPATKASMARALPSTGPLGENENLQAPPGVPGRPERPVLVPHTALKQRSMASAAGRAALLHALAHIELNAIDLAADMVWRFGGLPAGFYRDWATVAREEAQHFGLLRDHLRSLGYDYGDFPAHNGLWEMAEKTRHDLLARLALVPRTLEARGLDASPPIRDKLIRAGDTRAGEILEIILRDEIGHVRTGNKWFAFVCGERGLDPVPAFAELAARHQAPRPRGPFNLVARRAAGFTERELAALAEQAGPGPDQGTGRRAANRA